MSPRGSPAPSPTHVAAGPELQTTSRPDSSLTPRLTSPYPLRHQRNRVISSTLECFGAERPSCVDNKPRARRMARPQKSLAVQKERALKWRKSVFRRPRQNPACHTLSHACHTAVLSHAAWPVAKSCLCANLWRAPPPQRSRL